MKSVTVEVEVYPDNLLEHASTDALLSELFNRTGNNPETSDIILTQINSINGFSKEDYHILRNLFIDNEYDKHYFELYQKILKMVKG